MTAINSTLDEIRYATKDAAFRALDDAATIKVTSNAVQDVRNAAENASGVTREAALSATGNAIRNATRFR